MRVIELAEIWDARRADRRFFAALATLAFVALGLQLVVGGTALTLTGTTPQFLSLPAQLVTWAALGMAWIGVTRALVGWSRRRGMDPLPSSHADGTGHRDWATVFVCFVLAVLAALLTPLFFGSPWGLAPVTRYQGLYTEYGPVAWLPMVLWAFSNVGRSLVVAAAIAFAQASVSHDRHHPVFTHVPWGGLIMGATFGVVALLTSGPALACATGVVMVFLGLAHVASGCALKVTGPLTVVALALV